MLPRTWFAGGRSDFRSQGESFLRLRLLVEVLAGGLSLPFGVLLKVWTAKRLSKQRTPALSLWRLTAYSVKHSSVGLVPADLFYEWRNLDPSDP